MKLCERLWWTFGTIFNNINIVRTNSSGAVTQSMKVPLAYGPKTKVLDKT